MPVANSIFPASILAILLITHTASASDVKEITKEEEAVRAYLLQGGNGDEAVLSGSKGAISKDLRKRGQKGQGLGAGPKGGPKGRGGRGCGNRGRKGRGGRGRGNKGRKGRKGRGRGNKGRKGRKGRGRGGRKGCKGRGRGNKGRKGRKGRGRGGRKGRKGRGRGGRKGHKGRGRGNKGRGGRGRGNSARKGLGGRGHGRRGYGKHHTKDCDKTKPPTTTMTEPPTTTMTEPPTTTTTEPPTTTTSTTSTTTAFVCPPRDVPCLPCFTENPATCQCEPVGDSDCEPCDTPNANGVTGNKICEATGLPNSFKCCPRTSGCKKDTVPGRLPENSPSIVLKFICSTNCGACLDKNAEICTLGSPFDLVPDTDEQTDDVVDTCPTVTK